PIWPAQLTAWGEPTKTPSHCPQCSPRPVQPRGQRALLQPRQEPEARDAQRPLAARPRSTRALSRRLSRCPRLAVPDVLSLCVPVPRARARLVAVQLVAVQLAAEPEL